MKQNISLCTLIITAIFGVVQSVRELPYISVDLKQGDEEQFQYKVVVPPIQTTEVNRYICYSKSLEEIGESYIRMFYIRQTRKGCSYRWAIGHVLIKAKMLTEPDPIVKPHHIDSGLCLEPLHEDATWDCQRGLACKGDAVEFSVTDNFQSNDKPLYVLPKDVSSKVGGNGKKYFLIVQMHLYAPLTEPASPANITLTFTKRPTKYNYQKFLLCNSGFIPANKPNGFFTHVGCEWKKPKVIAFHYYAHTHVHGVFAEGFLIRNNSWIYLGGQKTRERHKVWYDVVNGPIEIRPGDVLASRCLFINNEEKTIDLKSEDTCIFQLSIAYDIQYQEYFARPPGCISNSPDFTFCSNDKTAALCDR